MTQVTTNDYQKLADVLANAISNETFKAVMENNDKEIDTSMFPIDLCLKLMNDFDKAGLNQYDADGNIMSMFFDTLPIVGDEEPDDQAARIAWRKQEGNSVHLAEKFYVMKEGKPKARRFYTWLAEEFLPGGKELRLHLNELAAAAEGKRTTIEAYNNMGKVERRTKQQELQPKLTALGNKIAKAVEYGQQRQRFAHHLPAIRVSLATFKRDDGQVTAARSRKPIMLKDTTDETGDTFDHFTVGSFCQFDPEKAAIAGGTWAALKGTAGRDSEARKKQVVVKAEMSVDDYVKAVSIISQWLAKKDNRKAAQGRIATDPTYKETILMLQQRRLADQVTNVQIKEWIDAQRNSDTRVQAGNEAAA